MYEALNCSIPDVDVYLRRIGICGPVKPNLKNLNTLILQHQLHVPFEDLSASYLHNPVSLAIPALFDKIVLSGRGGYCFELNALFGRLLRDLGYDARQVFCRVVRGRDYLPPCAHEGIVVGLENALYFCDVGFGGPMPAAAVKLGGSAEGFLIKKYDDYWWTLANEREDILQFNTFPQLPQEFLAVNGHWSTSPESVFVNRVMVNLRTESGFFAITENVFSWKKGGEEGSIEIKDDRQFREILKEYFSIEI